MVETRKEHEFRKLTIEELNLEDSDLSIHMTMGLVIGGTWLDLMRLKTHIDKLPDYKVIYNTVTSTHIRIVSVEEFKEFQEWKKELNRK